ncbi:MAG: ClpXP protease specificity-enhancing factor [Pseudomonadota bacterium]
MTPSRPYLIRAMYQWMVDNGMTPHMLVDAANERVQVPQNHVKDGKIVLNLAPMAVRTLVLGNEEVSFSARFDNQPMTVSVPVEYVLAIYTRENGQGMMFAEEDNQPPSGPENEPPSRPRLKVVK